MNLSVPAGLECSYNKFIFPANITTHVTEEPVTSADNRVVKWSRLHIKVNGHFTQAEVLNAAPGVNATLDATMEHIRRKLNVNGKTLVYKNKGYGTDLTINAANGTGLRDVALGPKPGKFEWHPLGGAPLGCCAAIFSWEVSTHILECRNALSRPGQGIFTEVSFSVSYETDEAGLVTIATRGTASIPLSLRANNTIEATVDQYLPLLIRTPPAGFLRQMTRELSPDRSTCTFTITDRQVEVPYPKYVVSIDMKHKFQQMKMPGYIADHVLSGTVRLSPTAPKQLAWAQFFNIAVQRVALARRMAQDNGVVQSDRTPGITPPMLEVEENLFKNESRFTIRFRQIGIPLRTMLLYSGLWTPVNRPAQGLAPAEATQAWTAATWKTSLANNAQAPRGLLNARFNAGDDVIIDVCNQQQNNAAVAAVTMDAVPNVPPDLPGGSASMPSPGLLASPSPPVSDQRPDGGASLFDPETSWVEYVCRVQRITDHHLIRHKPLAGTVKTQAPQVNPLGGVKAGAANTSAPKPGWTSDTPDIIQQRCAPSMVLRLYGFGVRAGYRVEPPKILSYGGQPAHLAHESVTEQTLALGGGAIAYRTDWDLLYYLPSAPSSLPLPANPAEWTDAPGAAPLGKVIKPSA